VIQALLLVVAALFLCGVVVLAWRIAGKNAQRRRAGRAERNQQRFEKSSAPDAKANDLMKWR